MKTKNIEIDPRGGGVTKHPCVANNHDPLNNSIIDLLDQLLSNYDIPVSALDCDGGEEVVSSYTPPQLHPNGSAVLCVIVLP